MVKNNNKSVLGIVGSPRRGGNTEIMVEKVLSGAEEVGASIEKVILNELNIKPCQACNSCWKTGKCMHNDDMLQLMEKMELHPIWVIGTPIYWWGPTSQFKAFLDRWYGARQVTFKGRRVILTIPLEGEHEGYARHTVGMLTDVLNYLEMDLFSSIIAPGVLKRGAIREKPNVLEMAYKAGRNAVETLK